MDMNTMTLPKKGLKKYDYNIDMDKKDLKKLTKGQLIKLLLKKEKKPKVVIVDDTKPTRPTPRTYKSRPPVPTRRNKVNQLVQFFEDIILPPPKGFRDRPPKPTRKPPPPPIIQLEDIILPPPKGFRDRPPKPTRKPPPPPIIQLEDIILSPPKGFRDRPPKPTRKPPPPPIIQLEDKERITDVSSPKITQLQKALKNSTKSFVVDIVDNKDPLHQLTETKKVIEQYLNKELGELKGFKYIETLKMTFEKQLGNKTTFEKQLGTFGMQLKTTIKTAYFNSKTKTIINENEINEVLQTSRQELMKAIGQWISEGSGWTIKSVDGHYINLTKYKPLKGSSYIELPTELRNSSKGLINLQNTDSECFRWCHIRYLNPKEKDPQRIKKSDKEFIEKLDYSGIEFPITIKHINKIEKKNSIRINVFGYEEK